MLPNSRMIPSNNNQRSRSNSMMNEKKGFMSRLLATPPIPKEYNQPVYPRPKYEAVLGIQSNEDYNQWNRPRSSSSTSSIKSQKSSNGFTKLFKKKEKYHEEDDQPKVRPVNQKLIKRHSKIPLAPPPQQVPRNRTISQPDLQHLLANLPPEFTPPTKKAPPMPKPRPPSIRKSTGSYSIYSTFGASDEEPAQEETTSDDDDDDDDFVDATGVSQEDIEKETLAKRLSGGHFGSAGGLLSSIHMNNDTDEDLAKSMLNWKRHSDSSKRWSMKGLKVEDQSMEELSVPDKLVLRKEAERALNGKVPPVPEQFPKVPDQLPPPKIPDQLPPPPKSKIPPPLSSKPPIKTTEPPIFTSKIPDPPKMTPSISVDRIPDQLPPPQSQVLPSPPKLTLQTLSTEFSNDVWNKEQLNFDPVVQENSNEIKETAYKLWNEDESMITKEKMAEWLGQAKPFESAVLVEYMQFFVFNDMRLDNAFRKLCSKLYFKAEAQQIDRILEAFANRYWECNTDCIFGSADIVYAVVYSLLLLNTDLHVAQGSHARMTRSEFIRNTMSTVRDQRDHQELMGRESELEQYLKEMYLSVKHYQILQPLSQQQQEPSKRTSILGGRIGIKRSVGSIIRKSARESMLLPDESPRRESFSSSSSTCTSPTMMQYMNTSLFNSEPPYYKEGVVMRKHLLENANQKARHREWRECLLQVGADGELHMYALQDKSLFRHSSATLDVFHPRASKQFNGQWASHSQLIGKIELNHTLSNPLPPPGYNRHRPHVFALQQSDGGVYLFQVMSATESQEWVSTCNYWAARGSKEPLPGAISNMEYGWGNCLNDVIMDLDKGQGYASVEDPDSVAITDWIPPQPTMVSSALDEREQYESLQKYLEKLNNEINQHRDMKSKILIKFPSKCNNYGKVLNNWEARSKYLLHDIIKYQHYCDALEKSLDKKVEQPQEKLIFKSSTVDLFEEINQELSLHF